MATSHRLNMLSPSAQNLHFLKAMVSVDCVIFGFSDNELKVLLIKSDLEVYKDKWSLLGDLLRPDGPSTHVHPTDRATRLSAWLLRLSRPRR